MTKVLRKWVFAAVAGVLSVVPCAYAQDESGAKPVSSVAAPALPTNPLVDTVFTPVTPCRIADTRIAGGPVAAGTGRQFFVAGAVAANFTAQGGIPCGIPIGASAVSVNITVVPLGAPGDIRAIPTGAGLPTASFLNWSFLENIANAGDIAIAAGAGPHLFIFVDGNATNVVIDVLGYFKDVACQGGTTKLLGNCYETALRAADNVFNASDVCRVAGGPGGRLATGLELRSLGGSLALAAPPGEWVDSVLSTDNVNFVAMTVANTGGFASQSTLSARQFRCVYRPLP